MVRKRVFDTKIYKEKDIYHAVTAYSHLADFCVDKHKNQIILKAKNIKMKLKDGFFDEFSNFLLSCSMK